jgi:hypothetical protein
MQTIRLIRPNPKFASRGPGNGMDGLRAALEAVKPPWLAFGGEIGPNDIPWVWCWLDKPTAVTCESLKRPYILGPCVFFENGTKPTNAYAEKDLLNGPHCRMLFTDSDWYAEVIRRYMGPQNRAEIVVWPFPINPLPAEPCDQRPALLIYEKSGIVPEVTAALQQLFSPTITIRYGLHERHQLSEAARMSWACAYLSASDRGPLGLAEIMLSGCPAVGIPTGAPWIEDGVTGWQVPSIGDAGCVAEAIEKCRWLDPGIVRARAIGRFSAEAVLPTVLAALEKVSAAD